MIRLQITALALFLCLVSVSPAMAEEISIDHDGWYSWEVPAGKGGSNSCCYSWNNGHVERKGCKLGNGMNHFAVPEPCESYSDTMKIFVEVRDGKVRDIWPISSDCPVRADSGIITLDNVTEAQSIEWLKGQVQHNRKVADEAIMTLSFHTKDVALESLFDVLEDKQQRQKVREQALFWLVQSDYDEAFVYLDKLLK